MPATITHRYQQECPIQSECPPLRHLQSSPPLAHIPSPTLQLRLISNSNDNWKCPLHWPRRCHHHRRWTMAMQTAKSHRHSDEDEPIRSTGRLPITALLRCSSQSTFHLLRLTNKAAWGFEKRRRVVWHRMLRMRHLTIRLREWLGLAVLCLDRVSSTWATTAKAVHCHPPNRPLRLHQQLHLLAMPLTPNPPTPQPISVRNVSNETENRHVSPVVDARHTWKNWRPRYLY
mmetsp:Transcript_6616/g.14649  ORF Transcript_6616/g.14649 Transcript_6616/m.14649 type:complete len:231 (-) Transcript_6616:2320-3012(-)